MPNLMEFNKLFQSERPLIGDLMEECFRLVRTIGVNFIQPQYVTNNDSIKNLNIRNESIFMNICDINIGSLAALTITTEECAIEDQQKFKECCMRYYKSLMQNCLQRLPLSDDFLRQVGLLSPLTALNSRLAKQVSFVPIFRKFPSLKRTAETQYNNIAVYFDDQQIDDLKSKNVLEFWSFLNTYTNFNNVNPFKEVCQLAILLLTLPHANADVERVFSMCADIKTKKRNRLNSSAMAALVQVKMDLKSVMGIEQYQFEC